ncbi:MAG: hypothetical protein J0L75_08770, partial [Spirochaetes bacterium]|nr:hypothetical protein [Spirochaetota bacterium]
CHPTKAGLSRRLIHLMASPLEVCHMTTNGHAETNTAADHKSPTKSPKTKKSRKYRGLLNPENLPVSDYLLEPPRPLTIKKLEMLQAAWDAWAVASHGNDPRVYARAKDVLYSMTVEYEPELIAIARNTLKARD